MGSPAFSFVLGLAQPRDCGLSQSFTHQGAFRQSVPHSESDLRVLLPHFIKKLRQVVRNVPA